MRFLLLVFFLGFLSACQRSTQTSAATQKEDNSCIALDFEIETPDAIIWSTLSMKGEHGRIDNEDGFISRIERPGSDIILLDHIHKNYVLAKPKTYSTDFPPEMVKAIDACWKLSPSGESQKIGEWNCEEFVLLDTEGEDLAPFQMKLVAWITKDLKNGIALQSQADQVNSSQTEVLRSIETITGRKLALPGFIVRWESSLKSRVVMRATCKRIHQRDLKPGYFEIPAGYVEKIPLNPPNAF